MARIEEFSLENEEQLCKLGAALYSPARVQILKLLYFNSYSVAEIAKKLGIPTSSAALYVRSLEEAGLLNTTIKTGSRGSMKICSRKSDMITIHLNAEDPSVRKAHSVSMPIGCYTDACVNPSCGIATDDARIGPDDQPEVFFLPARVNAQILWTSSGYVEYKFPFPLDRATPPSSLILSFEVCSEAYNYNEDWPSDITIWMDGRECGTWRCPGDYGKRRGRLNPEWWNSGCTQYGKLLTLEISQEGSYLNSAPASNVYLSDFSFDCSKPITIRIGNKPDAEFAGGFNLFGERFGDFDQNIILSFIY